MNIFEPKTAYAILSGQQIYYPSSIKGKLYQAAALITPRQKSQINPHSATEQPRINETAVRQSRKFYIQDLTRAIATQKGRVSAELIETLIEAAIVPEDSMGKAAHKQLASLVTTVAEGSSKDAKKVLDSLQESIARRPHNGGKISVATDLLRNLVNSPNFKDHLAAQEDNHGHPNPKGLMATFINIAESSLDVMGKMSGYEGFSIIGRTIPNSATPYRSRIHQALKNDSHYIIADYAATVLKQIPTSRPDGQISNSSFFDELAAQAQNNSPRDIPAALKNDVASLPSIDINALPPHRRAAYTATASTSRLTH